MSVGGQAQSGNQSGSQAGGTSGTQSGSTTGTQSGASSGISTGSTSATTSGSTSTAANAPDGYQALWNQITGMNGTTAGQDQATDYFSKALAGGNGLAPVTNYFQGRMGDSGPAPVGAQTVKAGTAADFMAPYEQGYTQNVVDATNADLLNQYGKNQNASNMAATAGGGVMNARTGLRDAQTTDDFIRSLASTDAATRDAGFGRAVTAGGADAGLNLQGQTANQGANLNADEFNVNASQQAQAQRDAAAQGYAGAVGQGAGINSSNATSLGNLGGQTFSQLIASLGAGNPLFGSTTSNTGSSSGNTSGTTGDSSWGSTAGTTDGTSNGTFFGNSNGNSSSKGGGGGLKLF